MKKIKIVASLLAGALLVSACEKDFEELEVSPNSPEEVTPSVLLTNGQVTTYLNYTGNMARITNLWSNQIAGCDGQYIRFNNYNFNENDVVNEWDAIYAKALMNLRDLDIQYGAENPWYSGMSKVLFAMNLGMATDLWGDVPNSEALQGQDGSFDPSYDAQQAIIADIQSMLDEAIASLNEPASANAFIPGSDDISYGGDNTLWIKAAYMIKARYAMRLSNKGAVSPDVITWLDNGIIDSSEDMMALFGNTQNNANQWWAFQQSRGGYIHAHSYFADTLNNSLDPRRSYYFTTDSMGNVVGTPGGTPAPSASVVADLYASMASSLPMITSVEGLFMRAEWEHEYGSKANAATAMNDAVKASILSVTGAPDAAYEAMYASEDASTITLEKIMFQKYVAMFTQPEVYNDFRRTGLPALTPNSGADLTSIPVRFPTSREESVNNPNATVINNIETPVWWDE